LRLGDKQNVGYNCAGFELTLNFISRIFILLYSFLTKSISFNLIVSLCIGFSNTLFRKDLLILLIILVNRVRITTLKLQAQMK